MAVAGGLGLRDMLRGVAIPLSIREALVAVPTPAAAAEVDAGEITLISPSS